MATTEKKPVTILGGKFELIGVQKDSTLILQGQEVRWDYLTKEQASELISAGIPNIKLTKPDKATDKQEKAAEESEHFPGSTTK